MAKMNRQQIRRELESTSRLIPDGYYVNLMRPPGGRLTEQVYEVSGQMGLSIIQWSVDPRDWATDCASQVEEVVLAEADDGDIILLHDMSDSSVEAALHLIDEMLEDGYVFLTVSQLAMLKGIQLEPGRMYSGFRS
jgi:peptidoglycan/xylan/chitin deacetylase (PgdA/CDA1 family)